MAVNLNGKFIPIEYFGEYNARVRPDEMHKITPEGEERLAQNLPFRITLDKFGNVYLLPLTETNVIRDNQPCRAFVMAYTINDIIEAASGNNDKRKMIEDVHTSLREKYFNFDLMIQEFSNYFWDAARSTFMQDYVNAFNKQPNLPATVTTHTSLSVEQAEELASKALNSTK